MSRTLASLSFFVLAALLGGNQTFAGQGETKPNRATFQPNQTLEEIRQQSHGDISALELLAHARAQLGKDTRSKIFSAAQFLKKRGDTQKLKDALKVAIRAIQKQILEEYSAHFAEVTPERKKAYEDRTAFLDEMWTLIPTFLELSESSLRTLLMQSIRETEAMLNASGPIEPWARWQAIANHADLITLLSMADRPDWKPWEIVANRAYGLAVLLGVSSATAEVLHPGWAVTMGLLSSVAIPYWTLAPRGRRILRDHEKSTSAWIAEITRNTTLESAHLLELIEKIRYLTWKTHEESCVAELTPSGKGSGVHGLF